ncbi:MAG: amidase [Chloroflexota bacterium]|nr:amidase [Chloroflexota bacterium]
MQDLPRVARAIRERLRTSRAVVEEALARYDEREPVLHAFAWLDRDRALRLADEADAAVARGDRLGPLHGVPIGVKDIFDTAAIPTENGSRLFTGRVPRTSAAAVVALERAGAIVIGKTVTTELAFYQPGPTTNPHDPTRTPGGSSMGSAASVAAGIVPGAIGSQTNGSVIRPAAFCGVVGVKPTHSRISLEGVMPFAPTLDHAGTFARTVEGAALLCAAAAGEQLARWWSGVADAPPRLAAVRTKDWDKASDPMKARFQEAVDALAVAGRAIEWPDLPAGVDDGVPIVQRLMRYEGAHGIGRVAKERPELVSEVARTLFAEGERISDAQHEKDRRERERLIAAFASWAAAYDAILAPPTTGEAPGLETTGDPIFCSRWSLLGAPAVTIPVGRGPSGLPLGLQLVGAPDDDKRVLGAAAWAERVLAGF